MTRAVVFDLDGVLIDSTEPERLGAGGERVVRSFEPCRWPL